MSERLLIVANGKMLNVIQTSNHGKLWSQTGTFFETTSLPNRCMLGCYVFIHLPTSPKCTD